MINLIRENKYMYVIPIFQSTVANSINKNKKNKSKKNKKNVHKNMMSRPDNILKLVENL